MSSHAAEVAAQRQALRDAAGVLWASLVRTVVPVIVGGALGALAAHGLEVDPEVEGAATAVLTSAGSLGYYAVVRLLEVYVAPWWGWLLGLAQSPDAYSHGAPPVDQTDDDGDAGDLEGEPGPASGDAPDSTPVDVAVEYAPEGTPVEVPPVPAGQPVQARTRAERRAWEAARDGGTLAP